MKRAALLSGIIAASGATGAFASDWNTTGFYAGAAAVQVRDVYTEYGASDQTQTSWKVIGCGSFAPQKNQRFVTEKSAQWTVNCAHNQAAGRYV